MVPCRKQVVMKFLLGGLCKHRHGLLQAACIQYVMGMRLETLSRLEQYPAFCAMSKRWLTRQSAQAQKHEERVWQCTAHLMHSPVCAVHNRYCRQALCKQRSYEREQTGTAVR
jgi:hypothetical protein